ncbi:hypothetical protein [Micromonospora sp. WMMD812]|uniref:hypothetical protein n=1 Tax=Micromonospora sp. WMMD812 TaxID=3015152 RepID=UPI00248ABE63|nr:hypothetical protein [Micromonospora sp. WMMD812]WBB69002.1 hypothetical protein O7603_06500 [Micromonospora sp. WMMD812]
MTDTLTHHPASPAPSSAPHAAGGVRHLLRHLGEMALAMVAGMLLLAPLWRVAGAPLGLTAVLVRPDVAAFVMATDMTVGMIVWMRHRRHSWGACAEMAAAMYVPFLVLLVPYWAGRLAGDALMLGGHLLMLPAMLLVALRHRHDAAAPARRRHPMVEAALRRWPAGLALLMTVDHWVSPSVLSPWTMLVLPAGYLVIGAYRGQLNGPGMLARQLAGLAAWSGLVLVAVVVGGRAAAWLVAAGWLAHAVWDVVHHRRGEVVPRGYAEWCAVLDAVLGITIVLAILAA